MDSEEDWPTARLSAALSALSAEAAEGVEAPPRRLAVLLSTGAMNPPHFGHVALLEAARRTLTERGYAVLAGYISPTHDDYVGGKCRASGALHLPGAFRAALADALTAPSPWLRAARWEVNQRGFVDFPQVADALAAALSRLPSLSAAGGASVFYACGADHYARCHFSLRAFFEKAPPAGVVCVPRAGEAAACDPARLHFLAEPPDGVAHLSSTALRAALQGGGDLAPFVPPGVAEALRRHVAGAGAGGAGAAGAAPAPPPARRVFISLSALLRDVREGAVPAAELEGALFFFGSKRFWVWPAAPEQLAESRAQGAHYTEGMPPAFRALLERKEARGEVFFLKPDALGEPDAEVFGDYAAASAWLQGLGYGALRLQREWWEAHPGPLRFAHSGAGVADNFERGLHGYGEVMELLAQSCPQLSPVLRF